MKKKCASKILAFMLSMMLITGLVPMYVMAANDDITVIISFEGFNLGHGFYVAPTQIAVPEGSSVIDVTEALLEAKGIAFTLTDWGGLDRIYVDVTTSPEVPEYITIDVGAGSDDGSIGQFDFTDTSGWLFTVNHYMAQVGPADLLVQDGDVIRWMFSIQDWGGDLGISEAYGGFTQLFEQANKTILIRSLFDDGMLDEYITLALALIIDPLSTQVDVDGFLLDGVYEMYAPEYDAETSDEEVTDEIPAEVGIVPPIGILRPIDFVPTYDIDGVTMVGFRAVAVQYGIEDSLVWNGAYQRVEFILNGTQRGYTVEEMSGVNIDGTIFVPFEVADNIFSS